MITTMQSFPVETWMEISQYLRKRDALALARTSSRLQPIAEASLYRTVTLDIFNQDAFANSITARPRLGAFVHDLILDCPMPYPHILSDNDDDDEEYNKDNLMCFATHPVLQQISMLLCNVQKLKLILFHVDAELCTACITHWPRLSAVKFRACSMDAYLPSQTFADSAVTSVTIDEPASPEGWVIAAHPTVHFLATPYWGEIMWKDDILLSLMGRESGFPLLMELRLRGDFTVDIIPLLFSAPQLRRLLLSRDAPKLPELPVSVIPLLEVFEGSSEHAGSIVCGRPVRAITLYLSSTAKDALHKVHSSVPIIDLRLGGLHGLSLNPALFLQHAPRNVQSLRLDRVEGETSLLQWMSALTFLPTLRAFRVAFLGIQYLKATKKQEMLRLLSAQVCPALQEVWVENRRWVLRKDGKIVEDSWPWFGTPDDRWGRSSLIASPRR